MSIVKAYLHPAGTLAFLFLQMGILTVCSGQQASLVVDINKTTTSGVLGNSVAALKGLLYFSGESQSGSGQELWRTDGTEQGTYMVKDIKKGEKSSMPSGLKATSGKLFFLAKNKEDKDVLHVSDGTEKGTRELAGLIKPAASVIMDDAYFYIRTSPFNNTELWRLNGNEDETF
ncbi:MAG: hypothetical protein IPN29_07430 [Saprospiraceae bacterium]|nr:hypothetical protein [Saprospiraceae bacterium]